MGQDKIPLGEGSHDHQDLLGALCVAQLQPHNQLNVGLEGGFSLAGRALCLGSRLLWRTSFLKRCTDAWTYTVAPCAKGHGANVFWGKRALVNQVTHHSTFLINHLVISDPTILEADRRVLADYWPASQRFLSQGMALATWPFLRVPIF